MRGKIIYLWVPSLKNFKRISTDGLAGVPNDMLAGLRNSTLR
jgi:hypothetical protein